MGDLEPLYSSKKKKVSTIMTFRPTNLPFCSEGKSYCTVGNNHIKANALLWFSLVAWGLYYNTKERNTKKILTLILTIAKNSLC